MRLSLLLLLLLPTFLIKGQNINQRENIDGLYFVGESESPIGILNWSKYSIIHFDRDTVRVIDYPFYPTGMLNYRVGTYVFSNSTGEIICSINNIYTISLNTGQIVWGIRRCKNEKIFKIEEGQKISMETTHFVKKDSEKNGFERVKEIEIRLYTQTNEEELKHKTEYLKRYEKYRRHPNIMRCREYKKSRQN